MPDTSSLRPGRGLRALAVAILFAVLAGAACDGDGGGDQGDIDPELQALLEGLVLTVEDLPEGLEQAGLSFSTNLGLADAAADSQAELAKLERLGRRLGIDVNFTPTGAVSANFPVRGGIQNTVSLYTTPDGASESFREGAQSARQTDWPSLYPELRDVAVEEVDRQLGDESVWFRITGLDQSGGLVIDDQVAMRAGLARSFLRVVSTFDEGTGRDAYVDQVEAWARLVADRIARELGSLTSDIQSPGDRQSADHLFIDPLFRSDI